MNKNYEFKLYDIVYHKDVYDYKEPLKIIGIKKDLLQLEGDFSGGTHDIIQNDWLIKENTSKIYNKTYKQKCRNKALAINKLCKSNSIKEFTTENLLELSNMILTLTNKLKYND